MVDRADIIRGAQCELARREFFFYCHLKAPDFYKEDRKYLIDLCNAFQDFVQSDDEVMVVNEPPRHGKSRTAGLLVEWVLGNDQSQKIMTGSYNETLSTMFSKNVRNDIMEEKADQNRIVFSDIFPDVRIKRGDGAMNLWSLEGGYNNYLATSPTGTATGFGATCFPQGVKVFSDIGIIDISKMYNDKNCIRILSYNHKNDILRYNRVIAKRRLISSEFVEVTTSTGRKIKSTTDHRYYTREYGYLAARELKRGYTVKTAEIQGNMCSMRTTQKGNRKTLQGMLRQEQDCKNRFNLFTLWKRISGIEISIQKSSEERLRGVVLFKRVFLQSKCRKTEISQMPNLWGMCTKRKKVLFGCLQKNWIKKSKGLRKSYLSRLWNRFSTKVTPNGVLLDGVQEQGTFTKNAGKWKFSLQIWLKLFKRIRQYKTFYKEKRQSRLSNLWRKGKIGSEQTIWNDYEFENTSQRRRYNKQYRREFNHSLPRMPYKITQDEKIIRVDYISEENYVYDLQVERDSNFFANGVLVHNCLIIDDLIKNAEEANNELTKEKHWSWFTDTMLSRLEEGGKIIIIMTRWASDDLAGRALDHFKESGARIRHISMKALQDDGTMLCDEVLSRKSYEAKIKAMGADIASANYQQEPIDLKGRLYTSFKTYSGELPQFKEIRNYTDTADTGDDYLCSINYGVTFSNEAYVLDVLYTKEPMEVTEPATAKMLLKDEVNTAKIESNNGGRGFARNVERILRDELDSNFTAIKWFTQSKNKQARIYSNSSWVMQHIYFPEDWRNRWPEYYDSMIRYQREGKNRHDDAQDATTGVAENCCKKGGISILK